LLTCNDESREGRTTLPTDLQKLDTTHTSDTPVKVDVYEDDLTGILRQIDAAIDVAFMATPRDVQRLLLPHLTEARWLVWRNYSG
jgi:hypothetical protein